MPNYTYDWGGRSPGVQNPGKYPRVGAAYMQFGEQPGYVYDPYKDIYVPDPKVANEYYQNAGLKPKQETPGLMATVGPIAATGLAYGAGNAIAKDPSGFYTGVKEGIGGLFGTNTAATGTQAATTGTQAATSAASTAGSSAGAAGSFGTSGATATESALGLSGAAAPTVGAGGTATIAAGAQVPAGYTAVGTAVDGGTMIAPTAGAEASTAGLGSTAAGLAGAAAAAYGTYQLYNNLSDNKKDPKGGAIAGAAVGAGSVAAMTAYGATYGSMAGPWGTVIGAAVGAIVGLGLGMIGGDKDKDQLTRDAIRKNLKKQGVLDENYKLTLNDGTQFDVGKDGHFVLPNGQKPYNVDFADARAHETVGALNPAMYAMIGGKNKKHVSDMVGYFTNAVLNSNDPQGNIRGIYDRMGGRDVVYGNIVQQFRDGQISAADADAARAAIDKVYGVKNPNQGKGGAEEGFFNLAPAQPQQQTPQAQAPKATAPVTPQTQPQQQAAPQPQQQQPQQPVVKKVTSAFDRGKK